MTGEETEEEQAAALAPCPDDSGEHVYSTLDGYCAGDRCEARDMSRIDDWDIAERRELDEEYAAGYGGYGDGDD